MKVIVALLVLCSNCLESTKPEDDRITPELITAFALVESSGREHVKGDKGKAWGLYQFHRARWEECGGNPKEWGKADKKEQTRVMINALNKYAKQYKRKKPDTDFITWCATYHNNGHGRTVKTKYVKKVKTTLKKVKSTLSEFQKRNK